MSALPEIAREAGLNPVICPYCGRKVSTLAALDLFFRSILRRILRGETVRIRNFGQFRAYLRKARGVTKTAGPKVVAKFTPAAATKRYLNDEGGADV